MRLFLIRHGESVANAHWDQVVESTQLNAPLTELGKQQSQKLADWMASKIPKIDALFTSSLIRTQETVAYLEEKYHIQAMVDDRIREGGYCYNTGEPIEDQHLPIQKRFDFYADPFAPFALEPAGVESYNDLRTRVGKFLMEIVEHYLDKTVVVINHGWVLNAFLDHVFNVGSYRSAFIHAENTSITYLEYIRPLGFEPWRVHFVAQTAHLEVFPNGLKMNQLED